MSFYHETVVWPSEDGTWNYGFYDCTYRGTDDDGDVDEWDAEFDFSAFEWATTGHKTWQEAINAWHGANPGGHTRHEQVTDESRELDRMAATWLTSERGRQHARTTFTFPVGSFSGRRF